MQDVIVLDCRLTLCEPVFFASREIDRLYLTEALIGNYALVYALGLASSPYFTDKHRPQYAKDLRPLVEQGIYMTPAHPAHPPRFHVERFNVQTETYWYAYTNGAILFDKAESRKTKPKPYANNRPQQGMIKMLAQGNEFRFFAFGLPRSSVPSYIRIGKFLGKARLDCRETRAVLQTSERYSLTGYYNPLDWPDDGRVELCNVINLHPVPVMQDVSYNGAVYRLESGAAVAAGLSFRFEDRKK